MGEPIHVPEGQAFAVISGGCSASGLCVQSPNYPSTYRNNEECNIAVQDSLAAPLNITSFNTEGADKLTVNGVKYSGTTGPIGIVPAGMVKWSTDSSVVKTGWRMCMGEPLRWAPGQKWNVLSGGCSASGLCVQSPNYPSTYKNNEECSIVVQDSLATPLNVTSFNTEGADKLTVNGVKYSGTTGPVTIIPSGIVKWSTD